MATKVWMLNIHLFWALIMLSKVQDTKEQQDT